MKVVLDTNIIVSSLLNPHGPSAQIVALVWTGDLIACCDTRIFLEYRTVLSRDKFGFATDMLEDFLKNFEYDSHWVVAKPLAYKFTDKDDAKFLEVAVAAKAQYLITGNLKHFPAHKTYNVHVVSPAKFLTYLEQ